MSIAVRRHSPPPAVAPPAPAAGPPWSVVLEGVPWPLYAALRDIEENFHVRMTYDRGRLELMSPKTRRHERPHHLLARLVQEWTVAWDIPMSTGGETTLQREDLRRGAEPDESFHVGTEAAVRAADDLRLPELPPPDLVIEADVTSSSVPRLPIFAAVGVPEVWRWRNETLSVLHLEAGDYVERPESRVLPGFPLDAARRLLAGRHATDETTLIRTFRESCRPATENEESK